jgi:hypothetical protein
MVIVTHYLNDSINNWGVRMGYFVAYFEYHIKMAGTAAFESAYLPLQGRLLPHILSTD